MKTKNIPRPDVKRKQALPEMTITKNGSNWVITMPVAAFAALAQKTFAKRRSE